MLGLTAAHSRCLIALIALETAGLTGALAFGQASPPAPGPAPPELRVFDPALVDKTVDPCENFYRYSCNGWFKRNPLPADQVAYGRFTELAEQNRAHLRQILEQAAVPSATRTANE